MTAKISQPVKIKKPQRGITANQIFLYPLAK